jgi:hypothetical protein
MQTDKYLYAHGCSYTDKDFKPELLDYADFDINYPKWPEIVADKLGIECVNQALCGASNDMITAEAVNHIVQNHEKIHTVMIGFTEVMRYTVWGRWNRKSVNYLCQAAEWEKEYEQGNTGTDKYIWAEKRMERFGYIISPDDKPHVDFAHWTARKILEGGDRYQLLLQNHFSYYQTIISLCKALNLRFILAQAIPPLCNSILTRAIRQLDPQIASQPYYAENECHHRQNVTALKVIKEMDIDHTNIIGYPGIADLGGKSLTDKNNKLRKLNDYSLCVGPYDNHPNHLGQIEIANQFLDKYFQLYGT